MTLMRNLGYSNNLEYMSIDEYFSQEEKKLFLKIPHKIEKHGKINVIDFDVPENGKYPLLAHIHLIEVTEKLTKDESLSFEYGSLLYNTHNFIGEPGVFIQSNRGSYALNLLNELSIYDKEHAAPLLQEYFNISVKCDDIISISDIFIKQIQQMTHYLKKEDLIVENLHLDYKNLNLFFDNHDEDICLKEINRLENIYGEPDKFPHLYLKSSK